MTDIKKLRKDLKEAKAKRDEVELLVYEADQRLEAAVIVWEAANIKIDRIVSKISAAKFEQSSKKKKK